MSISLSNLPPCTAGVLEAAKKGVSISVEGVLDSSTALVAKVAQRVFKVYLLYNVYEAAFSDILCLKTVRHGTDPCAWLSIHLRGPDLSKGGSGEGGEARFYREGGEEFPFAKNDKDCFFVAEDYVETPGQGILKYIESYATTKSMIKYYGACSTSSLLVSWLPLPAFIKSPLIQGSLGLSMYISPSVKFRFDPAEFKLVGKREELSNDELKFCKDESVGENGPLQGSLVTKYQFSVLDIGISGVIKNGLRTNFRERIPQHKGQFLWGLAQLVAAIALTVILYSASLPYVAGISAAVEVLDGVFEGPWGILAKELFLKLPLYIYTWSQI
ncbi:MAG: hypothetical protein WB791_11050 [Waddliaceae bacterium]